MKKTTILLAACMIGTSTTFAGDGSSYVYSSNAHAIVKVDTCSTNVLIAVPWTFYTPDNSPTTNLPINRLVKPEGLDEGDLLLNVVQGNLQRYQSWMLIKENGIGTWTPTISVDKSNPDVNASLMIRREEISMKTPGAEDPVSRGIGLWLVRTNPKDFSGNWKPVYLYGQWTKCPAKVEVMGGIGVTNAVMIANPDCTHPVSINDDMSWDFVSKNDTLSIPNGSDAWDMAIWNQNIGKWGTSKVTREVLTFGNKKITVQACTWDYDLSVPPGRGFWYIRRDVEGTCTINWK